MVDKKIKTLDKILSNMLGELQSCIVDAWSNDDVDFIVYWKPITLSDKQKIQKYSRGDDQQTTVYTVIFKALDKDGEYLFDLADKIPLMTQINSGDLEKIALKILNMDDIDPGK